MDLFRSVLENQHFDDDPRWLALEWFRKGLTEEHTLDEFIAYWSALEVMAGSLKRLYSAAGEKSYRYCPGCKERLSVCPECGGDLGAESPWSGLFHLIDQDIGLDRKAFNAVRKFRGGMLHGGTTLSNQAVEHIKSQELRVLRRLVIFALAAVFELPKCIPKRIAEQTVHRLGSPLATKFSGNLTLTVGEPPAIENIDLQPSFRSRVKSEQHEMNEEGKLAMRREVEYHVLGASYKMNRSGLWADESAGASGGAIFLSPRTR